MLEKKSFGDRIEGKEQFILFKKNKIPVGWQYLTIDILLKKAALLNQSSVNFSLIWMIFFIWQNLQKGILKMLI